MHRTRWTRSTHASALALLALLCALPAAAAHVDMTRYEYKGDVYYEAFNHGRGGWYKETNGKPDQGVIAQGGAVTVASYTAGERGVTGLQVHDVCGGVFAPEDARAWQPHGENNYAYLPWQTRAAAFNDDPARWLAYWRDAKGVDLAALEAAGADLAAECEARGGVFAPADERIAQGRPPAWFAMDVAEGAGRGESPVENVVDFAEEPARNAIERSPLEPLLRVLTGLAGAVLGYVEDAVEDPEGYVEAWKDYLGLGDEP